MSVGPNGAQVVLAMLTAAAEAKRKCPTNLELAMAISAAPNKASCIVSLLETVGLIKVRRGRRERIVTIVKSGAQTAGHIDRPASFPHHGRRKVSWTARDDAILMEGIAEGLDFDQVATALKTSGEIAAARFDQLRAEMGAQAA